jgi:hypothetical protein
MWCMKPGLACPRTKSKIGGHSAVCLSLLAHNSAQRSDTRDLRPGISIPCYPQAFRRAGPMLSPELRELIFGTPDWTQNAILCSELSRARPNLRYSMWRSNLMPIPRFYMQKIRSSCSHGEEIKLHAKGAPTHRESLSKKNRVH